MELVRNYSQQGLTIQSALQVVMVAHSTYYYMIKSELEKPSKSKAGRPSSIDTLFWNGSDWERHPNDRVIESLRSILNHPFVDYGYLKITDGLGNQGYWINHKKVYRLMKEQRLLRGDRIGRPMPTGVRVQNKMVVPAEPFVYFEMDIKQVYLAGNERNAYILTVIDVYTRVAMGYYYGFQLTQHAVVGLWKAIIDTGIMLQHADSDLCIIIRSDNGSQFIAHSVAVFMADKKFIHEFTHVASPEENGHIEAFHSILAEAMEGYNFDDLDQLESFLKEFYPFYNKERIHSSVCNVSPVDFYTLWSKDLIGEQMIRGRKTFYLKIKRYLLNSIITNGIREPECSKCLLLNKLPVDKIKSPP